MLSTLSINNLVDFNEYFLFALDKLADKCLATLLLLVFPSVVNIVIIVPDLLLQNSGIVIFDSFIYFDIVIP